MVAVAQASEAISAFLAAPNSRNGFLGRFLVCVDFPRDALLPYQGRNALATGMIYGTGPEIACYWSAAEVAARCWANNQTPGLPQLAQMYAAALQNTNANAGANIQKRSNVLIDFKGAQPGAPRLSKLELQYQTAQGEAQLWKRTTVGSQLHEPDATRAAFHQRLAASDYAVTRATPAQLRGGVEKERLGAGQRVEQQGAFGPQNYLDLRGYAVRRACKFLLYDTVGTDPNDKGQIHYALDGMTLADVAGQVHRPLDQHTSKVPVCTSELRELFRMWPYFRNEVTFYFGLNIVQPPWDTDSINVWAAYASARAQKAIRAGRVLEPVDQQTAQQVIQLAGDGQWKQAIEAYHRLPVRCLQAKLLPHQL